MSRIKYRSKLVILILVTIILLILTSCRIAGYDIESNKDLKIRKERVLELLEEKYGREFEIIGLRSSGSIGKITSFNIKAVELPYEATASLHRENTDEESFNEAYGSHYFGEQSELHFSNLFSKIESSDEVLFMGGEIYLRDQTLFRQVPFELDYYSFDNIYENHKEQLGGGNIQLIYFTTADEEEYTKLNEAIFEVVKLFKSWGGDSLSCSIRAFDISAKESEFYGKYQEDVNYLATDLMSDLLLNEFLLKSTGTPGVGLILDEMESAIEVHNIIEYQKDNTKGEEK